MVEIPEILIARLTNVAILAAQHAGSILRRGFGSSFLIESKSHRHDLVTAYDREVELAIIAFIKETFPDHTFLGEEGGNSGDDCTKIKWIIDPLDGTVNFAHQIPMFAVSIAATFGEEVLAGVVYHPLLEEMFIAEKGGGAFLNGKRLKVTSTPLIEEAMIATGFPYNIKENPLHCIQLFEHLALLGTPLRRMGSAALDLAYVAAGRFDAFWEVSLKPWDFAAGKLLITEAGGTLSQFDGSPLSLQKESPVAATNRLLHNQLLYHLHETH
ncbi:MAG: inositol monophosphatase [Simkaniaceae bacterium]|nr:inositol monophosphatase [Simkaniaceae bacterium]